MKYVKLTDPPQKVRIAAVRGGTCLHFQALVVSASRRKGALTKATCSARSLIPRSIFWLITKLTASAGSTRNRAHGLV